MKICDLQGINFQNIQTVYIGQKKKKNTKSKNGQISTVLQRRHTDSQKAHEKMLDTANYSRTTIHNHNEVSPHTDQNVHLQKVYK